MALELFNTLSGKVEEFHPLEDNLVRMYACGPTVYDYGHIGNFRTFIVVDTLRRFLKQSGFQLKHVMNITDVDDKIIRNAARDGVTVQEYTKKYRQAFLEDADALNIEHPELVVNATDHIQEMAHFIAGLVDKGYAYRTDDGSYYFRIAKFPEYGKLSKKDFAGHERRRARRRGRVRQGQCPRLCPVEGAQAGRGDLGDRDRPGASGLAHRVLHHVDEVPGRDLRHPPRRRRPDLPAPRERDRAVGGDDRQAVRARLGALALPAGGGREDVEERWATSITVRDLMLMGHKPSSIRFLLMSVPYRKQLNFTFDGLTQAANSVERLRNFKLRLETEQFPEGTKREDRGDRSQDLAKK